MRRAAVGVRSVGDGGTMKEQSSVTGGRWRYSQGIGLRRTEFRVSRGRG